MTPRDPLSSWFDDAEPRDDATLPDDDGDMPSIEPQAGPRRGFVVVSVLAVVVWAAAAALWLAGDDTAMQAVASTSASPAPSATLVTPVSVPTAGGPASTSARGDDVAIPAGADAVAEITVHELVTGDGDERWVDAAAVERWVTVTAEAGSDLVAVAVVRTMLLEAGPESWERRRQTRYGVAVRCEDDVCRPASQAWPLPLGGTAGPSDAPASGAPVDGHAGALLAAGYAEPAVEVLSEPLPGVVEVEVVAVPPGGVSAETHRVWLRTSPSLAVIGADSFPARSSPDLRR